jgi:DNA helicase-2/ATP-dependent DNA helicase PcrA
MKVQMLYGPPGTGKTTELLRRLEIRLQGGVDRNEIAYLSFTKAAAEEALRRMNLKRSDKVCTIHAMVYRLLKLTKDQVVDKDLLQELAAKIGIAITGATADSERELELGDEFLSLQQLAVAQMEDPLAVYERSHRPGNLKLFLYFCESYKKWKEANGFLDFNDMLSRYVNGKGPEIKARVMFIDEAQDLSRLQWRVVERLAKCVDEVHIGGDDDQAIFEWSGADPAGMALFEEQHQGERQVLSQSWRLPRRVFELGNRIISRVRRRVPKSYAPRDAEGVINRYSDIWQVGGLGDEDTLILYRNHSTRKYLEEYLVSNRVPYETMAGWNSPLQGRYGQAIRTYNRLANMEDVAQSSYDAMVKNLAPSAQRLIKAGGFLQMHVAQGSEWQNSIMLPWAISDYLMNVDFDAPVRVRLGSIHSAKGREAERVILYTAMGRRTIESAEANPDAESRVWYVGVTRSRNRLDIVEGAGGYEI